MNVFVIAVLAVALIVCVLALVREARLRHALQRMLKLILEKVRPNEPDNSTNDRDAADNHRL